MTVVIGPPATLALTCVLTRVCMADMPSPYGRGSEALDALCEYAVARPHHALREELRQVVDLLRRPAGDRLPAAVVEQVEGLAAFLELHLTKEENILFPALTALAAAVRTGQPRPPLPFPTILHPVRLLEGEHVRLLQMLDNLRLIAAELAVAPEGGERWRHAYEALAALDADVAAHVRFENEVLFPLAIDVDRQLS